MKGTVNNKNIFWISAAMVLVVLCIGSVISVPSPYGDIFAATSSGPGQHNNLAASLAGMLNNGNSGDSAGMGIDAGGNSTGVGIIVPKDETGAVVAPGIAADNSGNSGDTTGMAFNTGGNGPGVGIIIPKGETGVVAPDTAAALGTAAPSGEFSPSPITEVNPLNGVDPVNVQGAVIVPEFPTIIIPVIAMAGFLLLVQVKRKN